MCDMPLTPQEHMQVARERNFTQERMDRSWQMANAGLYSDPSLPECPDTRETGMQASIKHFYRKDVHQPWKEWAPDTAEISAESARNAKFALVVRREQDTNVESGLRVESITIQSPLLRTFLQEVFEGCRSVNTKLKQTTFSKPFWDFFYRWDRYEECLRKATDTTVREHVELLDSIVRPEILSKIEHKRELEQEYVITFDYLWTLYEPGREVVSGDGDDLGIFMVQQCAYKQSPAQSPWLQVVCRYVDYDGCQFGFRDKNLMIAHFEGPIPIMDAGIVPVGLHPARESLIQTLSVRGRKFESLAGVHYKSYRGVIAPCDRDRRSQMIENGRVMVDAKLLSAHFPVHDKLFPLEDRSAASSELVQHTPSMHPPTGTCHTICQGPTLNHQASLEEHHYYLCSSKVKGYDLTTKQWVRFHVNGIHDIQWNPAAFKRLYLPQDHKDLILAFVESHMSQENKFDDIVEGKGKGMVMLLSGVPGVGKTLTAEAVAEKMKAPLYSMSAGQLGPDIETVEEALRDVLDICAKWGAVLLIDEADVFLERRQMTDIHRNKLVSICLRLLEYYQGCMFLTTNRIMAFDAAFKSRIDLHIDYPNLDDSAKKHIWQTFVTPVQFPQNTSTLGEDDLNVLAKLDLNGREIKNLVKTGRLLATRKGEELGMQHLRTVLRVQAAAPSIESEQVVYPPLD